MPQLAPAVATTPHSGIRTMVGNVARHGSAISLVFGEPDFLTPSHIIDAAHAAARGGRTKYAPSAGFLDLREAIADKLRVRNGVTASAREVIVTTGGTGGLFTSLLLLVQPGDEVLLPDPGWSNYAAITHVLGAVNAFYPLRYRDGRPHIDFDLLERTVTARTRVLLVNSPGNPTGAMFDEATLGELARFAERHDLWIVSDECYDEIVFSEPHVSMAAVADRSRVISVFTFSKTYAMTGWRVGYVVAPPAVAEAIERAQEPVVSCASSVSQAAAEAALRGPQDVVATMRELFRERLVLAQGVLRDGGVAFIPPQGAFYVMVDITRTKMTSWDFATRLLDEHGVGVVPGKAFGEGGEGYVRISTATSPDLLTAGVERLVAAVNEWSTDAMASLPAEGS